MAERNGSSSTYTQGYSNRTISTHLQRTAESDAAFVLPHITKTSHILDVGCGPGTITTGLARYATEGKITGVDISTVVLNKAKELAAQANVPVDGPGSVTFEEGNILDGLKYPDESFDVIFSCQLFGHLPGPVLPITALIEIRRLLRPGGVLATRNTLEQHFYPRSSNLDELWVSNQQRAFRRGEPQCEQIGSNMPALLRQVGFDADGGRISIGAQAVVSQGRDIREWLASRAVGQLQEDDAFRQSWLNVGITQSDIEATLKAVKSWALTEDAWYLAVQGDILAWK